MILLRFMKKSIFVLLIAVFFLGCDSSFDFDASGTWVYTKDEDGDPVIENIDEEEYREEFHFGEGGGFCYGYQEPDAEKAEILMGPPLPASHDLSEFLPPVGNQGKQGSCVGWAAGYYLKSFHENYEDDLLGIALSNYQMSPAYIYNQIKIGSCAGGSVIQHALDTLQTQGIVDWSVMPYDENTCSDLPDDLQKIIASPNQIDQYYYLGEEFLLEQAKAYLYQDQPIVIALSIDAQYFGARDDNGNYIYRKFKKETGSHAMLVVGYDDDMNAFKVVNSWGKNWGNDGFVWLDYSAFSEADDIDSEFKVLCEAWVTTDKIHPQPISVSYNANNSSK